MTAAGFIYYRGEPEKFRLPLFIQFHYSKDP